jgi:acyl-CoA thioester hydrolase
MDHMNVCWYTSKFDEATWHLMSAIGATQDYLHSHDKGLAALEQKTEYKMEVRAGELLVVRSRVNEIRNKIVRFEHRMFNSESECEVARMEVVGVHMDRDVRRSSPFPQEVVDKCTALFGLA